MSSSFQRPCSLKFSDDGNESRTLGFTFCLGLDETPGEAAFTITKIETLPNGKTVFLLLPITEADYFDVPNDYFTFH